jgi:serine/threonine protein kinase
LQIALDAAEGMRYLHSRDPPVIHRDLKASNLLVNASWTCKIAGMPQCHHMHNANNRLVLLTDLAQLKTLVSVPSRNQHEP